MWGLEYEIYPAVPQSYRNGKSGQMYNLLSANNVGDNGTLVKKLSAIENVRSLLGRRIPVVNQHGSTIFKGSRSEPDTNKLHLKF